MGQFKPMVKMETTEPSVELKLKKGGMVKKADGGMMGMAPPSAMPPSMPARGGPMGASAPLAPSLAARRRAMKMMGSGPAAPIGMAASRMKKGGEAESKADQRKEEKMDMSQDKAMIKKAFKQHDMQEHKGGKGTKLALKKGGKMATGGVVNGQGGYKKGGKVKMATGGVVKGQAGYATGGMIPSEGTSGSAATTIVDTAKYDNSPANTGGVNLGNAGGFKRGGATKKHFATGGSVNSTGSAVAMPQGRKPASKPVAINELAGTYKRGGRVASKMKLKEGGDVDLSKGAYDDTLNEPPMGMGFAKKAHSFMDSLFAGKKEAGAGRGFVNPKSVTKSKESVTVAPMKKGGRAC